MEAWEHIAPEWPPVIKGNKPHGPQEAWSWFEEDSGITRKRYAELIAVERVEQAARAKYGDPARLSVNWLSSEVVIHVYSPKTEGPSNLRDRATGPTLCDAAWACIQALGGGE